MAKLLRAFLLCFLISFLSAFGNEGNHKLEDQDGKPSLPDFLRTSLFSLSSPSLPTASKWDKVKMLVNQVQAYFFPPNVDFRGGGGGEGDEEEGREEEGGAATGGKMKEAISKSFEKSKETVEDTAKTAAKVATKTAKITKEIVERSLSGRRTETDL